jgi:NADH-quinone oxidoreductase subunit N
LFIGMRYSLFKNKFSFLLIFFVIQTISAFSILVFYVFNSPFFLTFSLLLKLSIFPFHFWYLNVVAFFPNWVFFVSRTLFKLPRIILINTFYQLLDSSLVYLSSVLTLMIGGVLIVFSADLRYVLLCSSVVNNSWFVLSQYCRLAVFYIFWVFYSFFLFITLRMLSSLESFSSKLGDSNKALIVLNLFVLSGLPPFPIFFLKMLVVITLLNSFRSVYIIFIMLSTLALLVGYIKFCFYFMLTFFSSSANLTLN